MSENLSQQTAILGTDVADGDLFYLFDISAAGKARSKKLTRKEARRALGDGYNAQTWAAGALTITPADYQAYHLEVLTITLSAGAYVLTIADGTASTRAAGNRVELLVKLPGTAGISIAIKNGAATTLVTIADDGSGDDALVELYHDGTNWKAKRATYPVNV